MWPKPSKDAHKFLKKNQFLSENSNSLYFCVSSIFDHKYHYIDTLEKSIFWKIGVIFSINDV